MHPPRRINHHHARVTVMGLGTFGGGTGAAQFWAQLGSTVTVTDLREAGELAESMQSLEGLEIRYVLGRHEETDFINADVVVVNPAVPPDNRYLAVAREHGAAIVTEIGTVMRMVHGPLFGVTGSNGKSTTTALLGTILQHWNHETLVGGNIGGSLLPRMQDYRPSAPVVLELSSFQLHYLGEQKISPHVALVTNLSPNHLDWHPDLDHYYEAKRNIIRFQKPHDTAVLNAEDPVLRSWAEGCTGRRAFYGLDDPGTPNAAFVRSGRAFLRVAGHEAPAFQTADLPLPGRHNLLNALGASLAAGMLTHQTGPIKEGVSSFTGLPHRLEWVGKIDGRHYYNDSIATTPESVIAALTSFESPRVLIAGGYDKGIDFDELGRVVAGTAEAAVLLGDTAPKLHSAIDAAKASLGRAGDSRPVIHRAGSFEEAVRTAASLCPDGGAVLMSPGCASYDMFANFQERGEAFRRIVGQLGGKG